MSNSFLQSKEWSEFQESFGRKIFRVENKLVIKHALPLGFSYLYSPRPYFAEHETFKSFLKETAKLAKHENAIFLRLEPDINSNFPASPAGGQFQISNQFSNFKLLISKPIQPQDTLILDLHHIEETLLANMHPKTRYNIRLAEKHGITIKKSTNLKDINIFYNLALKTSARDNFSYHPRTYYEKMLEILGKNKIVELLIAYHKETPVAAILVVFYRDTAIYLHGASDHEFRNLMAPYLIQWDAIKEAKHKSCKTYDFWGIAPENTENHAWMGITRFKKGFAPNTPTIHYPPTYEIVYNNLIYQIYKAVKRK